MEVYTPAFNKIRELIQEELLKFIGEKIAVDSRKINEYILKLKKEKVQENKDFELIDFTYSSPYSPQVEDLLVDLIRSCIVKETRNGYQLTSYGYKMIDKQ
ncbi:MAG: hypothetical protein ACFFEY_17815 [Candidatus Thorarchaeota archaeon]